MLVVVSPAKSLNWDAGEGVETSDPVFAKDALSLAKTARQLTLGELRKLMSISEDLARLNRDRFKAYSDDPSAEATRPAAYAFAGDTYQGLEFKTLDEDTQAYAQDHLRILSGLYGVLRPLDAMQPYRLEMGSRLKTRRGKNLYDYWGSEISEALNAQAAQTGAGVLVNCASQEYFGAVDQAALKMKTVTPTFLEDKDGKPKIVSFFAKRARGAMARFVVENRVSTMDALLRFEAGGYKYVPELSKEHAPAFVRPYPK
ncbi:peroxide stress protein YaaA [Nereida sp. MMG025]|uniref:peroxide stress protein YaaA n=1 Tax=Nereida sp. MMG025 TaxID=2909981 RepID=UPI001F1DA4E0|nr:peroxide stress protein YaaA [Nereida sp. MMG025]MCF6444726.1 peroxide stress protein YaaA [Nereida sp. MMG025]